MKASHYSREFSINNEVFKVEPNSIRLKDLKFETDYIVVPERVWLAFISWYGNSLEVCRKVIKYPLSEENYSYRKRNLKEQESGLDPFIKVHENYILEIEIEEIFIRHQKIKDDGKAPSSQQFKEIYVSRKLTMNQFKEILCHEYEGAHPQRARIWLEEEIVIEELSGKTLEKLGVKSDTRIYLECMLESDQWPTDEKVISKILKHNPLYKKSKGLFNLGNTCYMNGTL